MQFLNTLLHFEHYLDIVTGQYGSIAYIVIFVTVFCETALLPLFFLPGDPLLFFGGALCAIGTMNIWILMGVLFAAAAIGSIVSYWLGNAIGNRVFIRNYKWLNQAALLRTRNFYERHGGITLVLAPFVAVVRTFAPFVAGVSAMRFRKFLLFTIAGDALWTVTLVPGGYYFGNIPFIRDHLNSIVLLGIGAGVGSLLLGGWRKYHKRLSASSTGVAP